MPTLKELSAWASKFENSFQPCKIPNFPSDLSNKLKSLKNRVQQQSYANESLLNKATLSLLTRLYILSVGISESNTHYSVAERVKVANNIIKGIDLITTVLNEPGHTKALIDLENMLYSGAFELSAPPSWRHFFLSTIDKVVNGINTGRAFFFRSHYTRSRLATREIINKPLQQFISVAENKFTSRNKLSSLRPQKTLIDIQPTESDKAHILYLTPDITTLYNTFYLRHQQDIVVSFTAKAMLESLDRFAKETLLAQDNQVINAYAEQAFLASQELVAELLSEHTPSVQRMKRLTVCFEQTAKVIANPGKKSEVRKLEKLVEESDYKRFHCDKEKTTYAIIHILVSAALLALAIVEAVISHGISLASHLWIIGAEGGSLGVGFGQLYYFSKSEIKNTFFSHSMEKLAQVAKSKSRHEDWQDKENSENRREQLLHQVYQNSVAKSLFSNESEQLLASLETLRKSIRQSQQTLLYPQANAVLQSAEELTIDLFRSQSPSGISAIRMSKLRECIDAANEVVLHPDNLQAMNRLVTLISQGDYETKKIIKRNIIIACLLAVASIALYIITITGTIFSAGATSGTIISPVMLSAVAAHKFAHASHRERTRFSDEAEALTELAQVASHHLTSISPEIIETPALASF